MKGLPVVAALAGWLWFLRRPPVGEEEMAAAPDGLSPLEVAYATALSVALRHRLGEG